MGNKSGMAIASLILGILSIVSLILGLISIFMLWLLFVGIIFPILGLIFGIIALRKISKDKSIGGKGKAVTGIVLSSIVLAIYILILVIGLLFSSFF